MSFNVVETVVGGVAPNTSAVAKHANPQLAPYERDHLPDLTEIVQDFLTSMEGRRWLWQFSQSLVGIEEIEARFGQDIAEAFQMWVALQKDMEMEVKNAADCLREESRASSSDTATVPVEVPGGDLSSVEGAEVARVMGDNTAVNTKAEIGMEHNAMQEVAGIEGASEDNGFRPGAEGAACEVEATMPDSLQDDASALRAGLGDALSGLMPEDETVGGDEVEGHDGNGGGTGGSEQGNECEVHAAHNLEAHEEENTEEGHAMDVDGGEPYVVPPAWARVLRAWNDPAIGAGFPTRSSAVETFNMEPLTMNSSVDARRALKELRLRRPVQGQ